MLKARFTNLLADEIRPFLKERGFGKSGSVFSRRRGPLYDVIAFQGSSRNGLGASEHRFYVNIGIGSRDVDGVDGSGLAKRPILADCLVERRWRGVVETAPNEVNIRLESDPNELAADVRGWLGAVVTVLDNVVATDDLVDLAVAGNHLQNMDQICAYLARTDDVNRLRRYVDALRAKFGADVRWPLFNRRISELIGGHAAVLRGAGVLDDV